MGRALMPSQPRPVAPENWRFSQMQTDDSRLLRKSYISAKFGDDSAFQETVRLIENALIASPKTPALELAESVASELDRDALFALAVQPLAALIRKARAKRSDQSDQPLLPGFEHLPRRITIPASGSRVQLLSANTSGVREYCRVLMKRHRDRRKNDPKVKEAYALLARMQRAARKDKGITVREVLLIDG